MLEASQWQGQISKQGKDAGQRVGGYRSCPARLTGSVRAVEHRLFGQVADWPCSSVLGSLGPMVAQGDSTTWHRSSAGVQIPAKRYRIGEIVRCSPFSRQTIHNYTIMGLIREAEWTEGGHRLYDETVFQRLSRIDELRRTKSLAEIRRILTAEEYPGPSGAGLGGDPTGMTL